MLFHTLEFILLFGITIFARIILPKSFERIILLIASYTFYAWWSLKFLTLLIFSTLIDYFAAKLIHRNLHNKDLSKIFLIISLIINLGILFIFKYFIWVTQLGGFNLGFNLVLPLGISFYTFQSISYTIDVYRKKIQPENSLLSYALYVSFFPQLVAGPIERSDTLLPQINRGPKLINSFIVSGLSIFIWGLVKKVIFGDNLGNFVNEIYSIHNSASSLDLLLASYAFAFQIYCDFSGYTDMARGVARLLGYEMHKNFDSPYFAQNIREFWQKWHITLSTWFRDYLYIPLGGNRSGTPKEIFNILVTMIIAGLWHGANLTFLAWGALHGLYISIFHLKNKFLGRDFMNSQTVISKFIKIFFTFNLVTIGWIFFRSSSLKQAFDILNIIILRSNWTSLHWETSYTLMIIFIGLIFLRRYCNIVEFITKNNFLNWIFIWLGLFSSIVFGALQKTDFIYFQF
jgi:alginate O-acetyltransferase complex protein AlgI